MQLSYDYAKDRALMCLRANYESHLLSGNCCTRTATSGSSTSQKARYTSTRLRSAGIRESEFYSSQYITRPSRTYAVQSPRIIEPQDLSWAYSSLPTEKRHCSARTYDRCHTTPSQYEIRDATLMSFAFTEINRWVVLLHV